MELKPYQQEVINDLELFLKIVQSKKRVGEAFHEFWTMHPKMPLQPFPGMTIEPYKNNVPDVPHVCMKVPTAGGKTFIACNAIKTIFDAFRYDRAKAVVWLVPSVTILDQTIRHLQNNQHPYRQKINAQFANRVAVYDKQALLQGSSFNITSVQEQLSIFVLSFDSLRARNKEDRKVNDENSNLQSFAPMIGQNEEVSLMRVIQSLNPVLIVDESHNAESELSVEMLTNLNPCFILDLTATPRRNSNIISFVDAMALKRENMVKLPVVVYNHHDRTEVINSALQLQRWLQLQAGSEEKKGRPYIRPIVLFQAQPKNATDRITFERVKEKLIESGIPAEEIAIKTATINELKGVNLSSRECPVRYIITVNALKEGWDCPFAYILASLADRSSAVDVEQILGRILRQPYVMEHDSEMLNASYVLTASDKFLETLENIVKGLNRQGFSSRDFKVLELSREAAHEKHFAMQPETTAEIALPEEEEDSDPVIDVARIMSGAEFEGQTPLLTELKNRVREQGRVFEEHSDAPSLSSSVPTELGSQVKHYDMKKILKEEASQLMLPQFYISKPAGTIFNEEEQLLAKEDLLDGFNLAKCDANINFNSVSADLYKIDLDEASNEHTPSFVKIDGYIKHTIIAHMNDPVNKPYRLKNFTAFIMRHIGNIHPIPEHEVKRYIHRVLEDFNDEQYNDFDRNRYSYSDRIKDKIRAHADVYAEKIFRNYLDIDKIFMKPAYAFAEEIIPGPASKSITRSLYEKEAHMNGFEEKVINEVANLPNVVFWTKNVERTQFKINGFLNHFPDFIIYTQRKKLILLETKGDDRDNSDSEAKIRLGKAWEKKAGNAFKYFMVFDKKEVSDAYLLHDFLQLMREM